MNRKMLLAYQWLTGLSDTLTGAALYVAPLFTLRTMGVHAPADAAPYVGYIGAFVFSVGMACLYGVQLIVQCACADRLETVWLITAFSRSAVALYLMQGILAGTLAPAWLAVALFDGACVMVQAIGLRKRWIRNAL